MTERSGGTRALPVDSAARLRAAGDLETSFCVEAGAGTGKTSLLVGRFLSILESGRASCSQIVAITFTEKAAGEMKIRLRQEIGARRAVPGLAGEARANLERALDELERSPISTIHSFAATILREYPVEARVDPNYSQLDALESALLFDECWSDFLARGAREWEETLRRFIFFGGSIDDLGALAARLYAHRAERACERIFGGGPLSESCALRPRPNRDPSPGLRDEFAAAAARLSALERDCCADPADRGSLAIREFVAKMEALDLLRGDDLTRFLLAIKLPKNKGSRGNWRPGEACAEQKGIFADLDEFRESARADFSDYLRDDLERFFDEFLAFVERRKASLGVLDFDDLLIRVRELLRSGDALDALRNRYRYILVDEFQDTDPVQAEIVFLIAGAAGGSGAGAPDGPGRPEPAPGKLFIVGDPKQSIYRFRKADIEVYERAKERLSESGERLSIVENFRSVPGIVGWVNETFSEIMRPSGDGRFQPRYEAIHPFRPGSGAPVVLLDLELAEEESRAQAIRAREGEAIARLVHRLIDDGMTVMDPRKRAARPLEYGDIAVIYPGTTGIDHYEEPLRAESIPYVVEGGKLYYAREEVRTLAAAVWAIEDPYDPLALVAALRSPMFGASDEDIFLFTRSGGRLDYLDPGEGAAGKRGDLGPAFDLLSELHAKRNELGPSGTLLELLRRTKFLELSLLRPHGDQRVSNIRKAVSSARGFEQRGASYRRFARWFRDQEALASAEGESPIVEEGEGAVRLLTVHRAKGLQFPVVILANLIQSRRASHRILVQGGRRISFNLGLLETSDHVAFEEEEKAREAAETIRLLYVAATRAGEMLVIPSVSKEGSYFGLIKAHLGADAGGAEAVGADRAGAVGAGAREKPARSAHVRDLSISSLPSLRGKPRPFTRFAEPARGAAAKAARERSEWLLARERLLADAVQAPFALAPSKVGAEALAPVLPMDALPEPGAVDQAGSGSGAPPARLDAGRQSRDRMLLFGLAFHRIMELADLADARSSSAMAAPVASALGIEEAGPELERVAAAALGSDIIARASRSPRCFREVPFAVPWEGNFIEGRIDLLFEEDDRWTLVDYKTDDVTAAGANERIEIYRQQAAVYALALKSLGIECAGGIVLYFARPNVAKTIDYSTSLVAEAESLIRAAVIERTSARERSRPALP